VGFSEALPLTWNTNQNVAWQTAIPGYGWSSPILWGDHVYLTSVVNDGRTEPPRPGLYFGGDRDTVAAGTHHWWVYALDFENGQLLWKREVHQGPAPNPVHVKNTYASETPVTDGQRVYAYFGNVGLFCLDSTGKSLWSKRWPRVKTRANWGSAASPVLHGDRLYLINDNEDQSFLVALDAQTGDVIWQIERAEPSNWSTPCVWENALRTEIVTAGRKRVRAYDLDGNPLWELGGMSSIVIPTPVAAHDLLYLSSGFVGDRVRPVFAIRPGALGDISLQGSEKSSRFVAWHDATAGPYNPSPLVYGDYLYVLFDAGFVTCHEARTGRLVYDKQRINPEGRAAFTSSPWGYRNRVFCLSEDGVTYVIQAGPEFRVLAANPLEGLCLASPALGQDSLLIRTATRLYRICQGKPGGR